MIDSRLVEEGYLFIPIRGARVDGHDFIPAVFEKGALAVLSERRLEHPAGPYILVDSTEEANEADRGVLPPLARHQSRGNHWKRRKDQHKRDDRVGALREIPRVKDRGESEQ